MNIVTEPAQATKRPASHTVLLAAAGFDGLFTEWDLSVGCWKMDPERFGMPGHREHPDHKRLYMEITGQKSTSPVVRGLMQRVKPNVYRITPAGRSYAAAIADPSRTSALYDNLKPHVTSPVLVGWHDNPATPNDFADALRFLGVNTNANGHAAGYLAALRRTASDALSWCREKGLESVSRLPRGRGTNYPAPIHYRTISVMLDFLEVLGRRFPQLRTAKARRA